MVTTRTTWSATSAVANMTTPSVRNINCSIVSGIRASRAVLEGNGLRFGEELGPLGIAEVAVAVAAGCGVWGEAFAV
jgi:hypothetical protein